jgi:hypothetical protein
MSDWDQMTLDWLYDKMADSNAFLALFTNKWREDPTCLLQLAFAMMLEKPIYLLAPAGAKIPRALERIADGIERYVSAEDCDIAAKRLLDRMEQER